MNMPSEDYPNFFPTFTPPPPPPPSRADFFTVPPPPNFFTVLPPPNFFTVPPPTKNINSDVALTVIAIVCVVSLFFGALVCCCCWNKKKHQDESNVKERDRGVMKNKVTKVRSNKHTVYEYDGRVARSREGLMEARCGNDEPNTDCNYYGGDLDLESGPAESYSSSDDYSNFCAGDNTIVCNGVDGKWERIRQEWKGNRQVTAKVARDATTSNFCVNDRMVIKDCQGEEDRKAEEGGLAEDATAIIVRDNADKEEEEGMASEEEESAKNAMKSNAPENDLESASFKTEPSKSSTTGKSKKGKGKGKGG